MVMEMIVKPLKLSQFQFLPVFEELPEEYTKVVTTHQTDAFIGLFQIKSNSVYTSLWHTIAIKRDQLIQVRIIKKRVTKKKIVIVKWFIS